MIINKKIVRLVRLVIFIVLINIFNTKIDAQNAGQKYNDFMNNSVDNIENFIYKDSINSFEILIKEKTRYQITESQINVVNQDKTGISYLLIFGEDNVQYNSLVEHWETLFSKRNPTFVTYNNKSELLDKYQLEHAEYRIKLNGKEMRGLMKAIQKDGQFFILQVATNEKKWTKQKDRIVEIINSLKLID